MGREFAVQLARSGHDLVLVARDVGRLAVLAEELNDAFGAAAEVIGADLSRDEDVARVVARIDRTPIDVLVNNAGFGTRGSLARAPREGQDAMVRVHVLATHRLTQAAVQSMVARGTGAIIIVSSTASYLTSPGNVNYTSTKAWQRIYAESLDLELRGRGVYVQALCPGYTRTEFHERGQMDMSRYPTWVWMRAAEVVTASLEAMRRRRPVVVIPGTGYRAAVLALRYAPRWAWRLLIGRMRGRRRSA
jgi:short-subunit dehydrogenase